MDHGVIVTLPGEKDSLELHVQLCEQRYLQLIDKFDVVDNRLVDMNRMLIDIKQSVAAEKADNYKLHLSWLFGVIMLLAGWLAHYIIK